MSNIRTLQDLERTENTRPLPADWIRGPNQAAYPVGDEESGYTYSTQPQVINNEQFVIVFQTAELKKKTILN